MTKRVSAALLAVLLLIPLGIVPAAASPASPVVLATLVRTQENAAPDYAWAFHGDGVELTAVNQNAPVQIGYMGTARTPIVINNGAVNNNPADGNGWRSVGPMDVDSGITVDTATAFQLRFSTLGHDDIHFSATQKSTGSGPEFFALAYSFSATGPFTAIADSQVAVARLSNDTYSALVPSFTNFPLPASVDNQPVVYLRVYMVNSTLTNRANGNTSINNIRITSGEDNNNGSQPIPPHEWGLPALHIDAPNHPFEMERLQWHNGAMSLRGSDVDFENIPISIRGRGNTTWQNVPEKRPLRLRFHTPRHMPGSAFAHNDWIIINNGPDNTQLRTHMAMDFNRRMNTNMHYVSIAQPVHVYVNGEYVGIYTLTDERDASPGRMDLHLRENPADSDFFVEYCFRIPEPGDVEGNHFVKVNGRGYDIRFPENGAQRREHAPYIQAYLYRVSEAIRARDFDALTSLIEVSTFVDYYIILEFFHNLTHQHSNVLMSLSGEGDQRLLRMGPIWDFDSYFQDLPYNLDQLVCPTSSIISQRDPNYYFYWFGNLVRIPEFAELVRERWAQLRADGIPQQSIDQMRHMAETYRADFERYRGDAIFNAVQEHTEWFEARMEWLDDNMPPNFTQPQRTISWVNVLGIAGIVTLSVLNVFAIIWFLRILFAT